MARVVCLECDNTVGSYTFGGYDDEGHGIQPVCDECSGLFTNA